MATRSGSRGSSAARAGAAQPAPGPTPDERKRKDDSDDEDDHSAKRLQEEKGFFSSPTGDRVTIHGITITLDDIVKFAPVVTLHRDEQYLPVSIEFLVKNCSIVKRGIDGIGNVVVNPSPTLADLAAVTDDTYDLAISEEAFKGMPVSDPVSKRVKAPMYVCPQVPEDGSYVDLSFHFLYCFNGSQPARVFPPSPMSNFNCSLPKYGEHQGDIELMTVRVDKTLSRILFVRYNAHGDPFYEAPGHGMETVTFAHQHPIGRSAYHSHASYNAFGKEGVSRVLNEGGDFSANTGIVGKVGVEFSDFLDCFPVPNSNPPGPVWQPFDVVEGTKQEIPNGQLVIVGLYENKPINDQTSWVLFPGNFGIQHRQNEYTGVAAIPSEGINQGQLAFANTVQALASSRIPDDKKFGNGPDGFSKRTTMNCKIPDTEYVPAKFGCVWAKDHLIPNDSHAFGTSSTPAAVVFKDKLVIVHEGRNASGWLWSSSYDGKSWSNDRLIPDDAHAYGTSRNAALAVYKDAIYVIHEARGNKGWLWCGTSSDGVNFNRDSLIPAGGRSYGTSGPPALCVFDSKLWLVHRAMGDSSRLRMASFDGSTWNERGYTYSPDGNLPFNSHSPPSMVAYQDRLWCFTDNDRGDLCYCSMSADLQWSPQTPIPNLKYGTSGTCAAAVYDGKLFVLREKAGHEGYLAGIVYDGSRNVWLEDALLPNDKFANGTSGPPSLVVYKDALYNFRQGRGDTGWTWGSIASKLA